MLTSRTVFATIFFHQFLTTEKFCYKMNEIFGRCSMISRISVSVVIVLSFFSLLSEPRLVTVLFTNDSHGMAWAFDEPGNPGVGGIAARKTLVDRVRNEVMLRNGDLVLLSSGNVTMGDPRSNVCENLPTILGMNLTGYDGMLIGSHEFDFGMKIFDKMKKEARFPFISANLFKKGHSSPIGVSTVEKELINGVKIAIAGITAPELEKITAVGADGLVSVKDPYKTAQSLVSKLRDKNDIVIVLSNLGFDRDSEIGDSGLAKKVPGIDLIIGGRTKIHLQEPVKVDKTHIVQTEGLGKWVGRFDFFLDDKGKIENTDFKMYSINGKRKVVKDGKEEYENIDRFLAQNEAVTKMLDDLNCEVSMQTVGEIAESIPGERSVLRNEKSLLGKFVTQIMRERTGSDIALINAGSLRQGLHNGFVNEMDVFSVFPFEDTVVVGEITGEQLKEILQFASFDKKGDGGFLQYSGLTFDVSEDSVSNIKINGNPIENDTKYTFSVNSFLTGGGDGYEMFKKFKGLKNTGHTIPQLIVEFIKREKLIVPATFNRDK
jgi:5'-nucleotidase / UDP-sugar diphosphatase